jgi:hypothetical protein
MNTQQLLDAFGALADDTAASNRLWSDATRLLYLNEAQQEAAARARLLEDRDTEEVCQIAVEVDEAVYDVDPRVIFIRGVTLVTTGGDVIELDKVHPADLNRVAPGWRTDTSSQWPQWWTPWPNQKIRIEKPGITGTLHLHVVREPLEDCRLADPDATPDPITAVNPEIPARHHLKLVDWMLYRALNERDKEEKYDPQSADRHLAQFEAVFGPRSSAIDETWIQRQHGYDEHEGLY